MQGKNYLRKLTIGQSSPKNNRLKYEQHDVSMNICCPEIEMTDVFSNLKKKLSISAGTIAQFRIKQKNK